MSRFMTLHSLRIAGFAWEAVFSSDSAPRTDFPLNAPFFGSLRAGPHERFRRSTIRSAFCRPVDPDESRAHGETSATDVKVEHTRERPVTPRA